MNGGSFPLPVKNILGKVYSKLRNPTIARLFRYVGIAENAGYGMNKLVGWEKLTGAAPTIESDRTFAIVSFPLKSAIQRKHAGNDVENDVGNDAGNDVENLTERQRLLLKEIKLDHGISAKTLSFKMGISHSTIQRELKSLQNKGVLRRIGPDKGGSWKIISISRD